MSFYLASVGFAALGAAAASVVSEASKAQKGALKDYQEITRIAMEALKNSAVGAAVIALGIAAVEGVRHVWNSIPAGTAAAVLNYVGNGIDKLWNFTKSFVAGAVEGFSELPFAAQVGIPLAILIAGVSYIALPRLIAAVQARQAEAPANPTA